MAPTHLKIVSAEFVTSAAAGGTVDGIPRDGTPQLALAGRSNVGKSTLINALCRRTIARTSAAPGKTRLANVYRVTLAGGGGPGQWVLYLVDLPGYGYARGGASSAAELKRVADAYFADRGSGPGPPASGLGTRASGLGESTEESQLGRPPLRSLHEPRPFDAAQGRPEALDGRTPSPEPRRAALLLIDARHPDLDSDRAAAQWLDSLAVEYRVVATKIDKLSRSERARNLKTLEQTFGTAVLPVSAADGEGLDQLWTTIATLTRNP